MSSKLPPRRVAGTRASCRADATPLQILLQMGFTKHRALKALAATGNRSVQLASDWLLTHVNDTTLDAEAPREYILYACPTGALLAALRDLWDKSRGICGWNGAHNYPPHITLVSFFKAPDDCSLQIAKALKAAVEAVGPPPDSPFKLEPYISHNFMGLFVCEDHADYFKKIAVQYVKQVSSATISLEPHVKSLHMTLAYQFPVEQFAALRGLVETLQPLPEAGWQLALYSRDPRFQHHSVHKVTQEYRPQEPDELELVLGDYVYIDEAELKASTDGWVQGVSWLTGVSGLLPAVYTVRTAESDAWTLHRIMPLGNNADGKWESDSTTEGESVSGVKIRDYSDSEIGLEKSEESFKEWHTMYERIFNRATVDVLESESTKDTNGSKSETNGSASVDKSGETENAEVSEEGKRRWILAMRHSERVDLTYGSWIPFCFEDDKYIRKDLNMPLTLPDRAGGKWGFEKDSPLTRLGELQGYLVGEGLREAGLTISHVYCSPALRSVHTAHQVLAGLQQKSAVKIRVEPGLFECMMWHTKGVGPFMTPMELLKAGFEIDLNYKPYVDLAENMKETVEEYYERAALAIQGAYRDTQAEGGNILFVGHSTTLDTVWQTLRRLDAGRERVPYALNPSLMRVPYTALSAMLDAPFEVVPPPCPPCINTSSGRFDWKMIKQI